MAELNKSDLQWRVQIRSTVRGTEGTISKIVKLTFNQLNYSHLLENTCIYNQFIMKLYSIYWNLCIYWVKL